MTWRCPACRTELQHNPADSRPRTNEAYRCHVCRLDFVYDEALEKMVITPFDADDHLDPPFRPDAVPAASIERKRAQHK
jgi:rubredoxin